MPSRCRAGLAWVPATRELVISDIPFIAAYAIEKARIVILAVYHGAQIGLHMHQPLIPAGGADLRTAGIISNLQYMMENPQIGDNHNAPIFRWCYKRMSDPSFQNSNLS
jgi:hypothetical protein